jgi:hypothetical protein
LIIQPTLQDAAIHLAQYPEKFVQAAFPWGSGELTGETGPDTWQREALEYLGRLVRSDESQIRLAVKSGHGVGKSAFIAWIINWFITTRPNPQIVCTANTSSQLQTKTWRELAKWHQLSEFRSWHEWTATSFYRKDSPATWRANAIPWSKERSEAFAGTHEKHVLLLFDEASIIDDLIWEVAEGAMTTPGAIWIVFGNPTRNTGRFRECWGRFRHRWHSITVDSRTAKKADQTLIQQWATDYGDDSDFFRVRAKGEFPRASSMQFIPSDIVDVAIGRQIEEHSIYHAAKVVGVDVARFGDDQTVIVVRQGLAIRRLHRLRKRDTMTIASLVAQIYREENADAVFVDDTGVGGGVTDRLNQLHYRVIPVNVGETALDEKRYVNKRAEVWDKMRQAIRAGLCLPVDDELRQDLIGIEYGFDAKERLQLEKKSDMKIRGLASPDAGDAIALTYAMPIHREDTLRNESGGHAGYTSTVDDKPLYWSDWN